MDPGKIKEKLAGHGSPFMKNFFIALIMIGTGVVYLLQKFNITQIPVIDNIIEYVMAFLLITGGLYRLKKAFEWRVIHF